ncbi:hypothetical protein LLG95_00670 [bacterium]|nr:hypothetical protein [bacterium]
MAIPKPRPHWILAAVPAVYLGLRLPGLWHAPIFNDEAIYSMWVARMLGRPGIETALLPWRDDKFGFFPWLVATIDAIGWPGAWGPLLLWRCLSILSGLVTVCLIMAMAWNMAGTDARRRTIAALAAGLGWAVWPLAVMHERMALYDAPLTAAWLVAMAAILMLPRIRAISVRRSLLAGLACALPMAIKMSGLPSLAIGAAVFLLLFKRDRIGMRQLLAFGLGAAVVAIPLFAISVACGTLATIHVKLLQPSGRAIGSDLVLIAGELGRMMWISIFWPGLTIMAIGALAGVRAKSGFDYEHGYEHEKFRYWLLVWSILPIAIILLAGRYPTVYTRYYLPFLAPAWIAFGLGIAWLWTFLPRLLVLAFVFFSLVAPAWQSFLWIKTPDRALLLDQDRHQYVEGWPSGRQIASLRDALDPLYARGPVEFITFNSYANPSLGIQYLERRANRFRVVEVRTAADAVRLLADPSPHPTRVLFAVAGRDPFNPKLLPKNAKLLWSFHSGGPWPHDQRLWWLPRQ